MARWYALGLAGEVVGGIPGGQFDAANSVTALRVARLVHGEQVWTVQSVLDFQEAKAEREADERARLRKAGMQ